MKKSITRIICFVFVLVLILSYTNYVFKPKYGDGIYDVTKFYKLEDNTVDVLILGSSHAFEDFNTGTLWSSYGIASYVLGGSIQPMWNTYYYLKEALKTQNPALIILEGYMTTYESEFIDDSRIIKNNYGLRWSEDKINAIKISTPEDRQREFLLEYLQYHTRYTELSRDDFFKNRGNPLYKSWKGFGCNMAVTPTETVDVSSVTDRSELFGKTEEYYRKIIELAQEKGIPLLVVISPYARIDEDDQAFFNTAADIAYEYDVSFINYNLLPDETGIDYFTDAADNDHLNHRGNQKFSKVVGAYITENYNIPDRRGEEKYLSWETNADYISAMICNQQLLETTDRDLIIEKLLNPNYCLFITIDGECSTTEEDLGSLYMALGISNEFEQGIWYRDNTAGIVWTSGEEEAEQYLRPDFHDICMRRVFEEDEECYVNEVIIDNVELKKVEDGVNITVYDSITQSVVGCLGFNLDDPYNIVW